MTCERSIDAQRYHDDELVGEARAQFESHLASCADCRAMVDELASISRRLRSAAPVEMPAALQSQIVNAWKRSREQTIDRGVRRFAEFLTAAAAAVMLFMWVGGPAVAPRTLEERYEATSASNWEAVALVHPNDSFSEDGETVQVAQFMARDLSR